MLLLMRTAVDSVEITVVSPKNLKIDIAHGRIIPLIGVSHKRSVSCYRATCSSMFITVLFIIISE